MRGVEKLPSFSRQKDKILRQSVRLRKGANIVAPKNSLLGEIMRVDFDILGDFARSETAISHKISIRSRNLRKMSGNLNEILIFVIGGATNGTSRQENQGHPIF